MNETIPARASVSVRESIGGHESQLTYRSKMTVEEAAKPSGKNHSLQHAMDSGQPRIPFAMTTFGKEHKIKWAEVPRE